MRVGTKKRVDSQKKLVNRVWEGRFDVNSAIESNK